MEKGKTRTEMAMKRTFLGQIGCGRGCGNDLYLGFLIQRTAVREAANLGRSHDGINVNKM